MIRKLSPQTPVIALSFANTTATIGKFGAEELGGLGDVSTKANLLVKETGRPIEDVYIKEVRF